MIELKVSIHDKRFNNNHRPVIESIDFTAKPGEFVAIIGPSGCGKTTLLNMIAGVENKVGQTIDFSDDNKKNISQPKLGYIFQQPRLMHWMTVRENVQLVLPQEQHHQIDNLLDLVNLSDKDSCFPKQLSGGMQRRVGIARAFAINPSLLLLDEPFISLDTPSAEKLRRLLIELWEKQKATVIFVTHDLQEAIQLADRIIFLSDAPAKIIHQCSVDLPRPRYESESEALKWQHHLMKQYPQLLAGSIEQKDKAIN